MCFATAHALGKFDQTLRTSSFETFKSSPEEDRHALGFVVCLKKPCRTYTILNQIANIQNIGIKIKFSWFAEAA
jgi:hypothetical protein